MRTKTFLRAFAVFTTIILFADCSPKKEGPFTLTFIGHDSFALNSGDGRVILCDPYNPRTVAPDLLPFPEGYRANVVTISHSHPDHTYIAGVAGKPEILRDAGIHKYGDLRLTILEGREGMPDGKLSGTRNLISIFERDGVKVAHLGDSGLIVDQKLLDALRGADVVIINIDDYVFPQERIVGFMRELGVKTIVPSHWEGPEQLASFLELAAAETTVARGSSELALHADMPVQVLAMKALMARD